MQRQSVAGLSALSVLLGLVLAVSLGAGPGEGQPSPAEAVSAQNPGEPDGETGGLPVEARNPGDGLIPLNPQRTVLLDKPGGRVVLKTEVVLREGALEMLLCKRRTKEHESILAVDADALAIHSGLVAIGAEPGSVVRFEPEFRPPTGQRIDVFLQWKDPAGKLHREPAQKWVRYAIHRFYAEPLDRLAPDVQIPQDSELRFDGKHKELSWYGPMTARQREDLLALSQDKAFRDAIRKFYRDSQPREMDTHWVFAGSRFRVNAETGERLYLAEGGDVICVANFPDALLDVAAESTQSNTAGLQFEAYTERIPPLDTEVTVELIPARKEPIEKE